MRAALFLFFALCLICSCVAEFDISYTPIQNGGAEDGMGTWWYSAWVSSVAYASPQGSRCFRFIPPANSHADLRSPLMPIRRGEQIQLSYYFKSAAGASIQYGSSYVTVRSYGLNTSVVLSETRYYFNLCSDWTCFEHTLTVDPNAYYIDVRFMFNDVTTGKAASGTMYVDAISMYREIKYSPLYKDIKPLSSGNLLYVYTRGPDAKDNEFIAIQTLQGIVARTDRPRIWINVGDPTFKNNLANNYGIYFSTQYDGDLAAMLGRFKANTSGQYVLYSIADKPSISVATAMAGILNAVAIDVALESVAIAKGYTMAVDVRGKNCRWVWENYRQHLADDAVIVHSNDFTTNVSAHYFRDWSAATKTLEWWYNNETYSRSVYRSMAPASPAYGWQEAFTSDEGLTIKVHSEEGLYQTPCDWMVNLSVHAAFGEPMKNVNFKQKVSRAKPVKETGVHYVTFILSDADNILTEVGTNSFYSQSKFYANPHRGQFPMGWGMGTSLVELAPTGLELWYRNATPNDAFVAFCGLGYFYPSVAPYIQTHAKRLGEFMDRADLRTLLLIDRFRPASVLTSDYYNKIKWFTALKQVRGMFYLEYDVYSAYNGQMYWFDNKPMVTARYVFSDNEYDPSIVTTAAELASNINSLPKDPTSQNGYTFVIVHAWTKGIDDVYDTIQLLDSNVRVVQPEDFIEQLYLNMKPCHGISGDGDFDGDCRVDERDLSVFAQQWLNHGTSLDADADASGNVDNADFRYLGADWQKLLTE